MLHVTRTHFVVCRNVNCQHFIVRPCLVLFPVSLCVFSVSVCVFTVSLCVFSVSPVVALLSLGVRLCSSLSGFLVRLSVSISSLGLGLRRCLSLTLTVSLSLRLCSFKRKSLGENLGQRSASVRSLVLAAGGGPEGRGWEEEGGGYLVM